MIVKMKERKTCMYVRNCNATGTREPCIFHDVHLHKNDFIDTFSALMYMLPFSFQNSLTNLFFSLHGWTFQDFTEKRMDINGKVVVSYRWAENEHYVLAVKQGTLVVKVRRHTVLSMGIHCFFFPFWWQLVPISQPFEIFLNLFSISSLLLKLTSPEIIGSFWSRPVKSAMQDWTNWKRSQNRICTWSRIRLDSLSWKQTRGEWHGLTWILLAPDLKVENMNCFFH